MATLYHITRRGEWDAAQSAGEYRAPSLEADGFIHLSATHDQVERVANAIYTDVKDVIVLCIDDEKLDAQVKVEPPDLSIPAAHYDGELFPHLYGALNVDAVSAVKGLNKSEDGQYNFPIG